MLYPPRQRITEADGVVKMNWLPTGGQALGPDVRMVFASGLTPPWSKKTQLGHTWIREHWQP